MNILVVMGIITIVGVIISKYLGVFIGKVLDKKEEDLKKKQQENEIKLDNLKKSVKEKEEHPPKAEDLDEGKVEEYWKKENE